MYKFLVIRLSRIQKLRTFACIKMEQHFRGRGLNTMNTCSANVHTQQVLSLYDYLEFQDC